MSVSPEELRDLKAMARSEENDEELANYPVLVIRLIQYVEELQAENALLKTAGIIEVAIRNPSVSEYMDHWEKRTKAAERREKELEAKLALSAKNTTDAYKEIILLKHREKTALIALEDMHDATNASGEVRDWLEQAGKEML